MNSYTVDAQSIVNVIIELSNTANGDSDLIFKLLNSFGINGDATAYALYAFQNGKYQCYDDTVELFA